MLKPPYRICTWPSAAADEKLPAEEDLITCMHQAVLQCAFIDSSLDKVQLPIPWQAKRDGAQFSHVQALRRGDRVSRVRFSASAAEGDATAATLEPREYEVRRQSLVPDAVAMGFIELLNAAWARAGLKVCGIGVAACAYHVAVLGSQVGLLEVLPDAVSLGALKQKCSTTDPIQRVDEYLGHDVKKVTQLAASSVGLLAANYLLGVAAGDVDSLMLASDGRIFRVDYGSVFAGGRSTAVSAGPFDSTMPLVWLPKAVTMALGDMWVEVRRLTLQAFKVGMELLQTVPPAVEFPADLKHWMVCQVALLKVQHILGHPVARYIDDLRDTDFFAALRQVDCSFTKNVSDVLHDAFGWRNRPFAGSSASHASGGGMTKLPRRLVEGFQPTGLCLSATLWAMPPADWRRALVLMAALRPSTSSGSELVHSLSWRTLASIAAAADWKQREGYCEAFAALIQHPQPVAANYALRVASLRSGCAALNSISEHMMSHHQDDLEVGVALLCSMVLSGSCGKPGIISKATKGFLAGLPPEEDEAKRSQQGAVRTLLALLVPRTSLLTEVKVEVEALDDAHRSQAAELRNLAAEVTKHVDGRDFAWAASDLPVRERMGVVKILEAVAKHASTARWVATWARSCIAAFTEDADPGISRQAYCFIACAVHDDDEAVRTWSRGFLTEASDGGHPEHASSAPSPLLTMLRMASRAQTAAAS